jgi:Ca2+-binding RTX toxin-like protein
MFNNQSLQAVQNQLALFAAQGNFDTIMTTAFGSRLDRAKLQLLRQQWLSGNFSVIPDIQILSQGELGAANGAYAASLDKIFVSSDFLAHASESQVTTLILEEVGHRLDQLLNGGVDSAGDEGEIFSRLVNGESLSASFLAALRAEDDRGVITVGGVVIAIENENFFGRDGFNDTILGGDSNDVLLGGSSLFATNSGDDTLDGSKGVDIIYGLDGNDSLYGGDGNDSLYGGTGNDTLDGGFEYDILYGGGGNDLLRCLNGNGGDQLFGEAGNDSLYGGAGNDDFNGGTGNDILYGYHGDDTLYGLDENDSLHGGYGKDILYGGTGDDNLDGEDGDDLIVGEVGDDTLYGNYGDDLLYGGVGNDILAGGVGNDVLDGGDGDDIFYGYSGSDDLEGGDGNDTLYGDYGNDFLYGGVGNDILAGEVGDDYLSSGSGDDYLSGGSGDDNLYSGDGDDTISGSSGNDRLYGEDGDDYLSGGSGDDSMQGGSGDDYVSGGSDLDSLNGGAGNDEINGGDSDDTLDGGLGIDTMVGGTDNDLYFVDNIGDLIIENSYEGKDRVNSSVSYVLGNALEDLTLVGVTNLNGTGNNLNNKIIGNDSVNVLSGKAGNDTFIGGLGNDIYIIDADIDFGTKTITETATGGRDTLDLRFSAIAIKLDLTSTAPTQALTTANNVLLTAIGAQGIENVYGGLGNDTITGNALNNVFIGGAGNDSITGGTGDDMYLIDADTDGSDIIVETATGGIDIVDFRNTTTKAITLDLASLANQNIAAGITLLMSSGSIEHAYGGSLGDKLTGNSLSNNLLGSLGDDTLKGAAGNDLLIGGVGNDTFCFSGTALTGTNTVSAILGVDLISDFAVGVDKIALSKATFTKITTSLTGEITNFAIVATDNLVGSQSAAIVYSSGSGNLFYNSDGVTNGAANNGLGINGGNFAFLTGKPALTASSFTITA